MKKKPTLIVVLATIAFSAVAYFGFSPDLQAADNIADAVRKAADAITIRNWILAGDAVIALGVLIYSFVTGKPAGSDLGR
jgi:hypothetical protein